MGPGDLRRILGGLTPTRDRRVVLEAAHADDAGAVRLEGGRALLHTVDVITPIIDDPVGFGRIAAANAVSDIYAMGGQPTSAVSILALPRTLPAEPVREMLTAARDLLAACGAFLVGGHTVKDAELKLGFAITGEVVTRRMCTHGGARPGDLLVLSKPLGTGLLYAASRAERLDPGAKASWIASMAQTNRESSENMQSLGVRCATDVTGFGLAGHAANLARASDVDLILEASALPLLPGVRPELEGHPGPAGP
ncbi:MAG: selenide, water dikinase SelD, partial [Myxococcota bacterium]